MNLLKKTLSIAEAIRTNYLSQFKAKLNQAIWAMIGGIGPHKKAKAERMTLLVAERDQRLLAETVAEATLALASQVHHGAVLDEILRQSRRIVPYSTAHIVLLEGDALRIACWQGYETYGGEGWVAQLEQSLFDLPLDNLTVEFGQPLVIPDTKEEPCWQVFDQTAWIRSYLAVPICLKERVLGLLRLNSHIPGQFSVEDGERLRPLANVAAVALENARLYDQARQEIIERVRAEGRILAAHDFCLNLLAEFPALIWRSGLDAKCNYFNNSWLAFTGRTMEQEMGDGWLENVYADDRERCTATYLEAFQARRPFEMEYRLRRYDDEYCWIMGVGRAFNDPEGNFAGYIGFCYDITGRKLAEEETRQRNCELVLLNQIMAASASDSEPEVILQVACRELARAFGVSQATAALLEGQPPAHLVVVAEYMDQPNGLPTLHHIMPVADNTLFQHLLNYKTPLVVSNTQDFAYLTSLYRQLSERSVMSLLALPLLVEGEVVGSLNLESRTPHLFSTEEVRLAWRVVDQAAGALARARLAQTRRRLMKAIEQAAESVVVTDIKGTIIYVNPAFERISGYSRAEAIGKNPRFLKSGKQSPTFYQELWETITSGQVWQGRLSNRRKDGTLYIEEGTISPVHDESGVIVNYVSVKRDVTRELQLQEQYLQAQKMESLGRLAGGVAHDFNNLLTVIMGQCILIQRGLKPDNPVMGEIEEIKNAGQRAADLTRQLLAFSRRQVLEPRVLNLNTVVAELEKMLQRLIGEDVELITRLGAPPWHIKADPGQMEQIIVNLVVNARNAMPEGGKLTIETANVDLAENLAQQDGIEPGCYVTLTVSDTGIGMNDELKGHLFEPFFTSNEKGKGTGLGLATVFGIVEQSKGHIRVFSEPGQGATFRIYLPRVEEAIEPGPLAVLPIASSGTETILLVEDEPSVRLVVGKALRKSGYSILEAQHGQEALQLCQQCQDPIDLLVTDVVLPQQINGRELAERLALLYPKLKVLYISGYVDNANIDEGLLGPNKAFLQKPFALSLLTRKVRELLDARRELP